MSRRTRCQLVVPICFALLLLAPPAHGDAEDPQPFKPFARDSIFNAPLRDDRSISDSTQGNVEWLLEQIDRTGLWFNTVTCGMPAYWADSDTRRVSVRLAGAPFIDPWLVDAWRSVPIPPDAEPAKCGDRNFAVLQRQSDGSVREWEFWKATRDEDGRWSAQWGGATADIRTDRGSASSLSWPPSGAPRSRPSWNVTGSSLSMLAGVVTQAEMRTRRIKHALAMALPDTARSRWAWPAQRSDGGDTDPRAIPEGAHVRLPAGLDLSKFDLDAGTLALAKAAQSYGIVVRDRTFGASVIYGEPPAPGERDARYDFFEKLPASTALGAFPWDRLQVVQAPKCLDYRGCHAPASPQLSVDGIRKRGRTIVLDTRNSQLDQPRTRVRWDLEGDGAYETSGRDQLKRRLKLAAAPLWRVGVRMTTRDGHTATAERVFSPRAKPRRPRLPAAVPVRAKAPTRGSSGRLSLRSPARVRPGRRRVIIDAGCNRSVCAGRLTLRLASRVRTGRRPIAAGRLLAHGRYRVSAGGGQVVLRLRHREASLLRHAAVRYVRITRTTGPLARRSGP
jgi:hypothetical protein